MSIQFTSYLTPILPRFLWVGTVTSVNPEVEVTPGLLNTDPYNKGWVFTLSIDDRKQYDKLMNEEQYAAFLEANKPI